MDRPALFVSRLTRTLWKSFLYIARVSLAWVPPLLLAWLGALYVGQCLQVLLAPGTGVNLSYLAQGGVVNVRAESYAIDPLSLSLSARNVHVSRANGEEAAFVSQLNVGRKGEGFRVDVGRVQARVTRRTDGQFDALDLLPPAKPGETGPPIFLKIARAEVTYRDLTEPEPLSRWIELREVDALIGNGDLDARARIASPTGLQARLDLRQNAAGEWRLAARDLQIEVTPWRPVVERLLDPQVRRDLPAWNAEQATVTGQIELWQIPDRPLRWNHDLVVRGTGVRYADLIAGATVNAQLSGDEAFTAIAGDVVEPGRQIKATGSVRFSGNQPPQVAANLEAQVASTERVWAPLRGLIPKEVSGRGMAWSGPLIWNGKDLSAQGQVRLAGLRQGGLAADALAGTVWIQGTQARLRLDQATVGRFVLNGWVDITPQGALAGEIATTNGNLGALIRAAGIEGFEGLTGLGRGRALIGGTLERPTAQLRADALMVYRPRGGRATQMQLQADADWEDGRLLLRRGVIQGPGGGATAQGEWDVTNDALDLSVSLQGLTIDRFVPQVKGVALADFRVTGSAAAPVMAGRASAYGLQVGDVQIPRAAASLGFAEDWLSIRDPEISLGAGQIRGLARWNVRTNALEGALKADNLLLGLLGVEGVEGRVAVEEALLTGTMDRPVVRAILASDQLLAGGVDIGPVRARLALEGDEVGLTDSEIQLGGGRILAAGRLNLTRQQGQFAAEIKGVQLDQIDLNVPGLRIGGELNGLATWTSAGPGESSANGTLQLRDLGINDFFLGNGGLTANLNGSVVVATAAVGSTQGFLDLQAERIDLSARELTARVTGSGFDLAESLAGLEPQIQFPNPELREVFRRLAGELNLQAEVKGPFDAPLVTISQLSLDGLALADRGAGARRLGRITLRGQGSVNGWQVDEALWVNGDTRLSAQAESDDGKAWQASADLSNLEANLLSEVFPSLLPYRGRVSATVVAEQAEGRWQGQGSLVVRDVFRRIVGTGPDQAESWEAIQVTLDSPLLTLDAQRLEATADVTFAGIRAALDLNLPLAALEETPTATGRLTTTFRLKELRELESYLPFIVFFDPRDPLGGSQAGISGELSLEFDRLRGRLGGSLLVSEDDRGKARLALRGSQTRLDDLRLVLRGEDTRLSLEAQARVRAGGQFNGLMTLDLARLLTWEELARQLEGRNPNDLLAQVPLSGRVSLSDVKVEEKISFGPGKPTFTADKPSSAKVTGEVTLGGDLSQPLIAGDIFAQDVIISLPLETPPPGPAPRLAIVPELGLRLRAADGTTLNLPTGRILLGGEAELSGDLENLRLRSPLRVQGGTLLVGSNRIQLEEGGTVVVTGGSGFTETSVQVDLRGSTTVTRRESSDRFQTYRLDIIVRGNIMAPEGVTIDGSSDPPGLSSEEIRAIVGQRDLIEQLARTALGERDDRALTQALTSLAVPNLTAGLTENLAQTLKLDYVVLDYNPFDLAFVRAGKSLGSGFRLEFGRQLVQPELGPLKYDLRLSYRIPSRDAFLSRARLSIGRTELVPWRVGFDWAIRF